MSTVDAMRAAAARLGRVAREAGYPNDFLPAAPDQVTRLCQTLDLPPECYAWYRVAAPRCQDLDFVPGSWWFFAFENLIAEQTGYSRPPHTHPAWDPSWIRIGADDFPRHIVVRTATSGDPTVYLVIPHRRYQAYPLSRDLISFIAVVTDVLDFTFQAYNKDGTITDDNGALLPTVRDDLGSILDRHSGTAGLIDIWFNIWTLGQLPTDEP